MCLFAYVWYVVSVVFARGGQHYIHWFEDAFATPSIFASWSQCMTMYGQSSLIATYKANCSGVCLHDTLLDASFFVKIYAIWCYIYCYMHLYAMFSWHFQPSRKYDSWNPKVQPWLPSCESHPNALESPLAEGCWKFRDMAILVSFAVYLVYICCEAATGGYWK